MGLFLAFKGTEARHHYNGGNLLKELALPINSTRCILRSGHGAKAGVVALVVGVELIRAIVRRRHVRRRILGLTRGDVPVPSEAAIVQTVAAHD